ncbi:hypothetical protein [Nonlabens sp.]|uniref:hypothetical protein n=1 Tax=Nonlabens sp. TaxID=1888209 RepID=UPI003F69C25D
MIDHDLSILGQINEIYTSYTQKVRKEYKMYPNFIYKRARKKAMLHFLEQDAVFEREELTHTYETQARENILKEIKSLLRLKLNT